MRQPDDEMREAPHERPHETRAANRDVSRPAPRPGEAPEPTEDGFLAGLLRVPAVPHRADAGETRRSLEKRLRNEDEPESGEGLW